MAHNCPKCGEVCYCDIEDCLNNFPSDVKDCCHDCDDSDNLFWDDDLECCSCGNPDCEGSSAHQKGASLLNMSCPCGDPDCNQPWPHGV